MKYALLDIYFFFNLELFTFNTELSQDMTAFLKLYIMHILKQVKPTSLLNPLHKTELNSSSLSLADKKLF